MAEGPSQQPEKSACSESGSSGHSEGSRGARETPLKSGEKAVGGLRNQVVPIQWNQSHINTWWVRTSLQVSVSKLLGSYSTTGWEGIETQGQRYRRVKVRCTNTLSHINGTHISRWWMAGKEAKSAWIKQEKGVPTSLCDHRVRTETGIRWGVFTHSPTDPPQWNPHTM